MSVPEGKRRAGKMQVFVKAQELACYTVQIVSNEKVFPPNFRRTLTDDLVQLAKDIFASAWAANSIRAADAESASARRTLQSEAIEKCTRLQALIRVAHKVFHLSTKRAIFWDGQVQEVRSLLVAWRASDRERYKNLG